MTSYCPVPGVGPETPADRDYQGGFAAALMLKDLRLAMEAAQDAGADTPMGAKAAELYEAFADAGQGGARFLGDHPDVVIAELVIPTFAGMTIGSEEADQHQQQAEDRHQPAQRLGRI